jgi:hypothetical protein
MKTSAALLVLLLCPLAAYSQTLTTSSEYGLPIVKTKTEINQTGTLAKFDSNLGELTGATLIIYGAADFSVQATNNSPQSQTARIGSTTSLFITSSETALNNLIQSENESIDLAYRTPLTTFASGETINFGPITDEEQFSYDLAPILASLQSNGAGSFTINVESMSGLSIVGGGGNLSASQFTIAGAGAKIVYSYVPEPSSALLCGIAGLGLIVRRRR